MNFILTDRLTNGYAKIVREIYRVFGGIHELRLVDKLIDELTFVGEFNTQWWTLKWSENYKTFREEFMILELTNKIIDKWRFISEFKGFSKVLKKKLLKWQMNSLVNLKNFIEESIGDVLTW